MAGKKKEPQRRTEQFRWEARMALYEYFEKRFNLRPEAVDIEIEAIMERFKLRQGQPIDPKELWQKVGLELERKLTAKVPKK